MDEIKNIEEINSYFAVVIDIYEDSINLLQIAETLHHPTEEKHKIVIYSFPVLQNIKIACGRLATIEILKLLSEKGSNRFCFYKFLNKLINGEYGHKYKHDKELIAWIDKLREIEPIVEKVRGLRDSYLAHRDNDEKVEALLKVELLDIRFLCDKAFEFISFMLNDYFEGWFEYIPNPTPMDTLLSALSKSVIMNKED